PEDDPHALPAVLVAEAAHIARLRGRDRAAARRARTLGGRHCAHGDHRRLRRATRSVAAVGARAWPPAPRTPGALQAPRRGGRIGFVDTHLHLEELGDTAEVVALAGQAGVTRMIAMGVNAEHNRRALEMATSFPAVWAGLGHYPTEEPEPDLEEIRALAAGERVVAIGEVGVDFEHGSVERTVQVSRLGSLFA